MSCNFRNLFKSNCTKSYDDCEKFRDKITTSVDLVECKLFKSLSSMQDYKCPGIDGLTKEFYEYFWNVTKNPFMNSIKEARKNKKLKVH